MRNAGTEGEVAESRDGLATISGQLSARLFPWNRQLGEAGWTPRCAARTKWVTPLAASEKTRASARATRIESSLSSRSREIREE
jgi:hypothetical protein